MIGGQMKTAISFIFLFVPFIMTYTTAQELLVGGNMEDSTAWKVINYTGAAN
jgi:hypothetical protein